MRRGDLTFKAAKAVEGEEFTLSAGDGPVLGVRLVAVQSLERRGRPEHFPDPFALNFKGTSGVLCPQGLYQFENASLGRIEIFIVPIEQDDETGEFVYQAIFN